VSKFRHHTRKTVLATPQPLTSFLQGSQAQYGVAARFDFDIPRNAGKRGTVDA
jgi:hypothetical protein